MQKLALLMLSVLFTATLGQKYAVTLFNEFQNNMKLADGVNSVEVAVLQAPDIQAAYPVCRDYTLDCTQPENPGCKEAKRGWFFACSYHINPKELIIMVSEETRADPVQGDDREQDPQSILFGQFIIPVQANGDPHFFGIDRYDFKGRNRTAYALLSWQKIAANAEFKHIKYADAGPKQRLVEGSFMTVGHMVVRTETGRVLYLTYDSSRAALVSIGVDDANKTVVYKSPFSMVLDDVSVKFTERTAEVTSPEFKVAFSTKVKKGIVGPGSTCADGKCFLEVKVTPRVDVAKLKVAPHGLIGQSYDGDGFGIIGRTDDYKPNKDGIVVTAAMGEGAIEGVAADYEVTSKFATEFKFSRWGKTEAKPRDASLLTGQKVKIGTNDANAAATATELE